MVAERKGSALYLKSLALRGFKSFASATTLHFEPGITAVVGPNGSGKSNVVDAIAWVLGEQGAKALRGGKMEDVIFAGTADRQPLGRAEVTLTINNADGALPIDYDEVAITRRMFRDGASEYEINGRGCRLLDIQELLSDSGIGREMHVIVGQGQLDAVLSARPEDRRAFIEEAAGVLKHRKRKEKALRKLDAMQANLTRLDDLTAELRRQLKPLGRQAEVARRAMTIQSELRDARLRLLADDLVTLQRQVATEEAEEQAAKDHRERVQAALHEATSDQETSSAARHGRDTRRCRRRRTPGSRCRRCRSGSAARSTWPPNGPGICGARSRSPAPAAIPTSSRQAAAAADAEQAEKDAAVDSPGRAGRRGRRPRRARAGTEARRGRTAGRDQGHRRPPGGSGDPQRQGQRRPLPADRDRRRDPPAVGRADRRAGAGGRRCTPSSPRCEDSVGGARRRRGRTGRGPRDGAAAADRGGATGSRELVEAQRAATSEQRSLRARVDALAARPDPPGRHRRAAGGRRPLDGLLGPVSTLLTVRARAPRRRWRARWARWPMRSRWPTVGGGRGGAGLAARRRRRPGRAADRGRRGDRTTLAVAARRRLVGAGRRACAGRAAVRRSPGCSTGSRWSTICAAAVDLVRGAPEVRAVTADGDLLGAAWATGGRAGQQSLLEIQAAVDEAEARLAETPSDRSAWRPRWPARAPTPSCGERAPTARWQR